MDMCFQPEEEKQFLNTVQHYASCGRVCLEMFDFWKFGCQLNELKAKAFIHPSYKSQL